MHLERMLWMPLENSTVKTETTKSPTQGLHPSNIFTHPFFRFSPTSGRRAASTNLHRKAITAAAKMATNSTRSNLGEVGFYLQGKQLPEKMVVSGKPEDKNPRKIELWKVYVYCIYIYLYVVAISNHVIKSLKLCILFWKSKKNTI